MQPVMHRSRFVHHMHGLSAKVSRYLSHSITPPSHARDQEHQHGTCAAGLPGIYAVNLVSHTMGDGISPSARSYATCLVGRAGERQEAPRLARQQRAKDGDLGESFAIILVRTGLYGAWLRHTVIQRARDSGHASPRAPRARVELAPLWLCSAFLSRKQLSTKVPGRFYSTLHFRYRIHLYGRRVHSCFTWRK